MVESWTVEPSCLCCIPALPCDSCVTTGSGVSSVKWGHRTYLTVVKLKGAALGSAVAWHIGSVYHFFYLGV